MDFKLRNKTVLVTGASGGIGSSIARMFAGEGCSIVAGYQHNVQAASSLVGEITSRGGSCIAAQVDVGDAGSVQSFVKKAGETFGTVDVLVNNAGNIAGVSNSLIVDMPVEHWDSVLRTHVIGTFLCTQAAAPHLKKNGWGRIINISSSHALSGGRVGLSNYAAAKGAVLPLTKATAKELGKYGITANAIIPGFIAAGMSEKLKPEVRAAIIAQNPMQRLGTADEIAALAVWLASAQAGYITGQFIACDGGRFDYDL